MSEFFLQGDREKELGVPVGMLNDRMKVNVAHSQIGFIEFMIAPWVEALVPLFSGLEYLSEHTAEPLGLLQKAFFEAWRGTSTGGRCCGRGR